MYNVIVERVNDDGKVVKLYDHVINHNKTDELPFSSVFDVMRRLYPQATHISIRLTDF